MVPPKQLVHSRPCLAITVRILFNSLRTATGNYEVDKIK